MTNPGRQAESGALRRDFGRRPVLPSCGCAVTSDVGLPADRELDDALGLTVLADEMVPMRGPA